MLSFPSTPRLLSRREADQARREQTPFRPLSPSKTMEQAPLIDSALKVIFFDNYIENGRHTEIYRGLFASGDLAFAFAVAEAHPGSALDISLERTVHHHLARRNVSATSELVEIAKAMNRLRQSSGVEYLIPDEVLEHMTRKIQTLAGHKCKNDELLDQAEQEARQRAAAKRANNMFGREERARRRDGLKELETELDKKNQELATAESSLRWAQREVKRLERSLECQICRGEPWDTVTGCGHLFGAACIKQWLEEDSTWAEDDDGILVGTSCCPVCRMALSERELRRLYV